MFALNALMFQCGIYFDTFRYTALGIVDELPLTESLKDVTKRTSVFWDRVVVPDLREGKRILIVGHENNLRSIIKRLDGISDEDIIHLELPRGIPLVYHLDPHTLKPIKPLEEVNNNLAATTELAEDDLTAELLSGKFLVSKQELKKIADRDQKQVYDLRHTGNLELVSLSFCN
jgi:2,3-bisphosphoglycerate-dependent phosphoglycerate mutase